MFTIRSSYKYYKKNEENPVKLNVYLSIVLGLFKRIVRLIFEGKDVKLPAELGIMGIRGKKVKPRLDEDGNIKGLAVDWKSTKEMWARRPEKKEAKEYIYFFNEHTGGWRYRLLWSRKNMKFKNKTVYQFRLSKPNKRAATALFKSGREYAEGKL